MRRGEQSGGRIHNTKSGHRVKEKIMLARMSSRMSARGHLGALTLLGGLDSPHRVAVFRSSSTTASKASASRVAHVTDSGGGEVSRGAEPGALSEAEGPREAISIVRAARSSCRHPAGCRKRQWLCSSLSSARPGPTSVSATAGLLVKEEEDGEGPMV